nr:MULTISPECIES: hypothetical protein [unclassified Allomuricauda]|tara:strand:+ start:1451 stop:2062 length:612 start_codon:yes stop_codon:yes gene_type:complete
MSIKKIMWYIFSVIVLLVGLWYLVITRKINPDNYFKHRADPATFTYLNINPYKGGMRVSANLDNDYHMLPSGKMSYSINNGYRLKEAEYSFEVNENNTFKLIQLQDNTSMVLGEVVEKKFIEHTNTYLYKIKLPDEYQGIHEYARGMFPYYVPVQFTMMSSGGMRYSHEERSIVISPKGDTLKLYHNYGYMDSGEKSGIYKGR